LLPAFAVMRHVYRVFEFVNGSFKTAYEDLSSFPMNRSGESFAVEYTTTLRNASKKCK